MQVLDCNSEHLGIDALALHLPDRSMTPKQYLASPRVPFSVEQMQKDWHDTFIEPEHVFRFFTNQVSFATSHLPLLEEFASESGCNVVYISRQPSSDMAVEAARKLIRISPEIIHSTQAVIYYSSTLSTEPACSTPCRLQHELGLKGSDAFGVAQKGANVEFVALKLAAEMILAEDVNTTLLVGSERFVPPYERLFQNLALFGDSASAMVVSCEAYDFRLLYLSVKDHCGLLSQNGADSVRIIPELMVQKAALALREILEVSGLSAERIGAVLAPNLSVKLLRRISVEADVPWRTIYLGALRQGGCLGSSDLVASLYYALNDGSLNPGDLIVALGISAECSTACCLFRYEPRRART
jgi:3-oxoacyl-[acyl-carrier-protein] synthase III